MFEGPCGVRNQAQIQLSCARLLRGVFSDPSMHVGDALEAILEVLGSYFQQFLGDHVVPGIKQRSLTYKADTQHFERFPSTNYAFFISPSKYKKLA